MRLTRRTIFASLIMALSLGFSQVTSAEQDDKLDEMRALLKERDAAIIELQHSVKNLVTRLETIERAMNPAAPMTEIASPLTDDHPTETEPPQKFARLEVDEQAAQRALERTLVQGGALLLPTWRVQFTPSTAFSVNEFDFPALVADGDALLVGSKHVERSAFTANLAVQVGLPFDSQLELGLPYQWVEDKIRTRVQGVPFESTDRNGNGIGSFRVGLAKTFLRESGWRPDVVGRITWNTGSGDRSDSGVVLGGGFESLTGSLTFIKRSDPLVFFGSASYQTVFEDGDIKPGDQFFLSFGTALAVSPSSSLFMSLGNQFVAETEVGNQGIDGSDITAATLNLGASSIVSKGFLLNLTTGIGISENAPDYSIGLSGSVQTDALQKFFYGQ